MSLALLLSGFDGPAKLLHAVLDHLVCLLGGGLALADSDRGGEALCLAHADLRQNASVPT